MIDKNKIYATSKTQYKMNIKESRFFSLFSYTVFTLSTLIFAGNLKAQEYDEAATVSYINQYLDKDCEIFADKKSIRIEYNRNGKTLRVDDFYPSAIDLENEFEYSESENAIIIRCNDQSGDCIDKHVMKPKSKSFVSRTKLILDCDKKKIEPLKEALNHLIMLYIADDDYLRTKPFEDE